MRNVATFQAAASSRAGGPMEAASQSTNAVHARAVDQHVVESEITLEEAEP